jgi:hypothetical protein
MHRASVCCWCCEVQHSLQAWHLLHARLFVCAEQNYVHPACRDLSQVYVSWVGQMTSAMWGPFIDIRSWGILDMPVAVGVETAFVQAGFLP